MITDSQLMVSLVQGSKVHMGHANHEEDTEYDLKKPAERLRNGAPNTHFSFDVFPLLPYKIFTGQLLLQ